MSSTASSSPSPSPPASPAIPGHHRPPSLERLVQHFVSAKRALSTTQHVEKVTHLVNSSRTLIEETAVLNARNAFATVKVHQQIDTLHAIHRDISSSGASIDEDFAVVIAGLDAANDRLQKTLAGLKATIVNSSIQRAKSEHDGEKTLFDFVDESQYEDVSESVRTLIDSFQTSRMDVESSLDKFKSLIEDVSVLLSPTRPDSPTIKPTIYDEPLVPVAEAFGFMEDHAAEMANLLQSLIAHYDLCVSALKHTEGGQEAVRKAVLSGDASDVALDESLFETRLPEDISDEERVQMMNVLDGDAAEVDDVVGDIRERGAELERLHGQLSRRASTAKANDRSLRQAVGFLQRIRLALPVYIDAAAGFQASWSSIQASIDSKMKEIVGFRAFYEEFLAGYRKLLREVDRRRAVDQQMKKLALRAQKELDQLYKADKLARDEFVEEVASFLPSDLWPGVADPGARWVVNNAAQPSTESDDPTGEIAAVTSSLEEAGKESP